MQSQSVHTTGPYESAEALAGREKRRAALSAEMGELLTWLEGLADDQRLAWCQSSGGRFFFRPDEISDRVHLINRLVPDRKTQVVEAADRIMRHEFDILGSGPTSLGSPIDWHRDFKSCVRWRPDVVYPSWNWRKVDYLGDADLHDGHFYSIEDASDLKVPWDLSSFFHLAVLGEAYWQTGNGAYATEVIDQVEDWHRHNPFPFGVHWTCAMVAGIRLANLVFGLRLVHNHPDYERFMGATGVVLIVRHIQFILDFLEIDADGRRNNHYLNNLVGLAFGMAEIGAHSENLKTFVRDEVEGELATQFCPDGAHFEGSIPYHRFATESILLSVILLDRNGLTLSRAAHRQLRRILYFIDSYTKPDGLAPQIGDNDNGRILVFSRYDRQEYRDHRHILAVGAGMIGLDALATDVSDQAADVAWLLGNVASRPPAVKRSVLLATIYLGNGYAVAKTARSSLMVRCGPIHAMCGGGHNHCDQLSFELHDEGIDLIVDPGAYLYSADAAARNCFRSTEAHNTLQLDDIEQQDFNPQDLFAMRDQSAAQIDLWQVDGEQVTFGGHHSGFSETGWRVYREIRWEPAIGGCRIRDWVVPLTDRPQGDRFRGCLHFGADVTVHQDGRQRLHLTAERQQWTLRFSEQVEVALKSGHVSPSYGTLLPATVAEYRFPAEPDQFVILTLERAV